MAFLKRINYLGSFISLFILTGISFSFLIIFIIYVEFSGFKEKVDIQKTKHEYALKKEKITEFYDEYINTVLSLQHNKFFLNYINMPNKNNKENLITLFETIVIQKTTINQLRYIDENGQEIIRVERQNIGGDVVSIADEKLQNKSHREYFTQSIKNKPSEVYISKLDLNIENKKIEKPIKPVLRFSTPIYNNLSKKGIIVVNIFGKKLLDNLVNSDSFEIDVFDENDYLLVSNNPKKEDWARYLSKQKQSNQIKYIYKDTLLKNKQIETLYIGFKDKNWLSSFFKMVDASIIFLILFIVLISFVLAYTLSRIPKKLFDELEAQQNMLIQQSKVAAMGEMTGMLAHQWRQPLNTVSVVFQELEIKKTKGLLDDKEFKSLSQSIKETINHMSKTIDNFRDFYKVDKKKNHFNVIDVIQSSYAILEVRFSKFDISFKINLSNKLNEKELMIESFEGEFKQVIINILNNAVEALSEKKNEKKLVEVNIYKFNNKLNISIEDNGGGVKKEMLNKLFEPYSSTKLEKNGTGLGLYMSKMILQKNLSGNIVFENTKYGARFIILLNLN